MNKRILLGGLLLAVLIVVTGCGWFGPNVDEVTAADLRPYTASTLFQADRESVLAASMIAGESAGYAVEPMGERVMEQTGSTVPVTSFRDAFSVLVDETTSMARTAALAPSQAITVEENIDQSDPKDMTYELLVEITNETVRAVDYFGEGASGTATVETFLLELAARVQEHSSTHFEASGRGEQEMAVRYDNWTPDGIVIVHDGRVNTAGDGRVNVEVRDRGTYGEGDYSWRFRVEMSAGFSVSNTETDEGGKLIMRFSYSGRERGSFDTRDPNWVEGITGEFEAELVIQIYDNSNTLIREHRYTDSDAFGVVEEF